MSEFRDVDEVRDARAALGATVDQIYAAVEAKLERLQRERDLWERSARGVAAEAMALLKNAPGAACMFDPDYLWPDGWLDEK